MGMFQAIASEGANKAIVAWLREQAKIHRAQGLSDADTLEWAAWQIEHLEIGIDG